MSPIKDFLSMNPPKLHLDDPLRQRRRDDRLFRRESMRYRMYRLKNMPCPCTDCNGMRLLKLYKVRNHLMRSRRSPQFRVWKGPGEYDSSDAEWEAAYSRRRMHPERDEGMNLRPMIENRFQREHADVKDCV